MLSSVEEEAQRRLSVDSLESTERRQLDCAPVENLFFPNVVPTHAAAMMMDPPTVLTPLKPRRKSMEDTLGDAAYKEVLSKLGHRAEAAVHRTSRT